MRAVIHLAGHELGARWRSWAVLVLLVAFAGGAVLKAQLAGRDPGTNVAALRLETGELAWRASPADGGAAPVSVIPGVLFFGSSAGVVYAYSTDDGKALWQFDTAREFDTVNKVKARGGAIDVGGPAVAEGMILTTSGYPTFGGRGGNVLLAFSVDGR